MTAYVKNYHSTEERETYQQKLQYFENIGWRRDVPEPFQARPDDRNPASLERERIEKEEDNKDGHEIKMFDLFAEAVEDLYTGIVDKYVRKTPALWEFVMKLEDGNWYLVDPDPVFQQSPMLGIFVSISTTTSDFHHVCVCGQLKENWKRHMRSHLQDPLQNLH